jgi:Domain of unknown function (DUF1737)
MNGERIEEYRIVLVQNPQELAKQVNQAIAEGWQPFGNHVRTEQTAQWSQAVVKFRRVSKRPVSEPLSETKKSES